MTALLVAAHQRLAADVESILAKHPAGAGLRAMGIAEAETPARMDASRKT